MLLGAPLLFTLPLPAVVELPLTPPLPLLLPPLLLAPALAELLGSPPAEQATALASSAAPLKSAHTRLTEVRRVTPAPLGPLRSNRRSS